MTQLLPPGAYFVSGIDTDAGKSYATGQLARMLAEAEAGRRVITQKFIQTGCTDTSEDIELHRRLMGIPLQAADTERTTCPIIYRFPASPHLSAQLEGTEVDTAVIAQATQRLLNEYDTVLIEGAGGLLVPLRPFDAERTPHEYLTADYVAEHRLPLLFVTSARLGSLNHTLLSFEACRVRRIEVAAVLWKLYPAGDPTIAADTRAYIADYLRLYWPDARIIDIPEV